MRLVRRNSEIVGAERLARLTGVGTTFIQGGESAATAGWLAGAHLGILSHRGMYEYVSIGYVCICVSVWRSGRGLGKWKGREGRLRERAARRAAPS